MSPVLRDAFFAAVGLFSLWSLTKDLATGNAQGRRMIINVDENPGGFYLVVFCKVAFVCFAVAVILHALGVLGDPYVFIAQHLPFVLPS
jgi:hypothetical protein